MDARVGDLVTSRPRPQRALTIGRQRSSTDNHGRCPCRPSCSIGRSERAEGASQARGSFNTGSVCWGWRPVQPDSCSRAASIRVVASCTSCRSWSVNSAARYSTIQAILGRSWIIHGVSRSPVARSEWVSCVSRVSRLPQVGHLGAGVVMHGSMVRAEVPVHLVRAGSASHREPLVVGGHKRSRRAGRSRRPPRLPPPTPTAVEAARKRVRIPPPPALPLTCCFAPYLRPARERPTGESCEPAPRGRPRSAEPSRTAT
jgi:hypothetical protein